MKKVPLIRIVDDEKEVGESLRFVLEMAGFDVETYTSAKEFLSAFDGKREGCILLDVRMPEMSGLELQNYLQRIGCEIPIVFLSAHGDIRMAVEAVKVGAIDFLVKPAQAEELISILQKATRIHSQRKAIQKDIEKLEAIMSELTESEIKLAHLVAKGLPNKQIAEILEISEDTVRSKRASVFGKLDARNAVELSEFIHELETLKGAKTW